jgi:hypothetical protein
MVKSPSERVAAATGGESKNMPDVAWLAVALVGLEVLEEGATGKAACIICRVKTREAAAARRVSLGAMGDPAAEATEELSTDPRSAS